MVAQFLATVADQSMQSPGDSMDHFVYEAIHVHQKEVHLHLHMGTVHRLHS